MTIHAATLLTMAKTLDKHSPRRYGNAIGIQEGKAYTTDGFSLLRWVPTVSFEFDDRAYSPDLVPVEVNYPKAGNVFPTGSGESEDAETAIMNWMDENQFYPAIWYVSDHGNISTYSMETMKV